MSSARSADLFSAHFLLISCIHIILAGEYALLEKLIVAVFTELPLSLNVIFSLGDRRVFRNVGQTPAQDAALHLLSSREPLAFVRQSLCLRMLILSAILALTFPSALGLEKERLS